MRITLIDDSISFDGNTPKNRPLGGAEKAFVYLSEALAERDHEVVSINRCASYCELNGVTWLPWHAPRPPESDVLIAFRRPALLQEVGDVDRKLLWLWGAASLLEKADNQKLLERYMPTIVYLGEVHRRGWKPWRSFQEAIIPPGIGDAYLGFETDQVEPEPVAIITTHPLHGMDQLLQLWLKHIRSGNNEAQLHIYSAALIRGKETGYIVPSLKHFLSKVMNLENHGVSIKTPLADWAMAEVYGGVKLHLYPIIKTEMYGCTLAESQATGLPAVVRGASEGNFGAMAERVCDGQTGYIAPDDSAFVNLSNRILAGKSEIYWSLHKDALALQRQRSWQLVASEFEALWS